MAEKETKELQEALRVTRSSVRQHIAINQALNVELDVTTEQLDKYILGSWVDGLVREINFFENRRYGNTIRLIYYTLLHCSVAPGLCRGTSSAPSCASLASTE